MRRQPVNGITRRLTCGNNVNSGIIQ